MKEQTNESISKLVSEYMVNHKVEISRRREISRKAVNCEKCKRPFKPDDMKFYTPKYGVICKDCWCKEMGDFIEKHPIGGIGE